MYPIAGNSFTSNISLLDCNYLGVTSIIMQCQLQMHVTKRLYFDFVIWHHATVHIKRLEPDNAVITEANKTIF